MIRKDRSQKTEGRRQKICFLFSVLCFLFSTLCFTFPCYAKEVTILYTGQTHAMLYPCSCPVQQDGGIARRATLVKELRKKHPGLLLLDCGSFTAGGPMDEYAQNSQLDMRRTEVNLKAMELMRFDALAVGSEEFNFGKDFLLRNAKKTAPAFLSANLDTDKVVPYIIKDVDGVKIGIIGLTGLSASQKAEGLKINAPEVIGSLLNQIRKQGAEVIILLSTLGEEEDLALISKVKGIDIVFIGYAPAKDNLKTKIDSTFLVRPSWQGRKLGKLTLEVKEGRLVDCKFEEERLSDKLADDPDIKAILPRCYSDANCKKQGLIGSCQNPGELKSGCLFTKPNKVKLLLISAKDCLVCNVNPVLDLLRRQFPGLTAEYLYYPAVRAQKLVRDFSIQGLPAYLLGREVEKEKNFDKIKNSFEARGDFYIFKPQASGISYLLGRKAEKGSFDLFFSLFGKDAVQFLAVLKEFNPRLHFLAVETGYGFDAQNGGFEVEEYLRALCVEKYYPQKFWDYLGCRAKNINSSWWEDCLSGSDTLTVKTCARGPEGMNLLKENISLNKELQIVSGPVYLLDNHQIFSSRGLLDKEELKKIIGER